MWKRMLIKLVVGFVASVDWDAVLCKLLARLEAEIKEQLGVNVGLAGLDRNRLINGFEEVLSEHLGWNFDLNKDGQVGDGEE
jgi:hypothetical protein